MTSLLDCDASGRGVWRFRLLNIPISVQPWFWLTIAIMCGRQDAGAAFIWIAVCFGSILIHEMGHALAFRAFGIASEVVLYAWGGLAIPKGRVRYSHAANVLVSLAGPFAGFCLAGLVIGLASLKGAQTHVQFHFIIVPSLTARGRNAESDDS